MKRKAGLTTTKNMTQSEIEQMVINLKTDLSKYKEKENKHQERERQLLNKIKFYEQKDQEEEQNFQEFQHYMQELKERFASTQKNLEKEAEARTKLSRQNEEYQKVIAQLRDEINKEREAELIRNLRSRNSYLTKENARLVNELKEREGKHQALQQTYNKLNEHYKATINKKDKLAIEIKTYENEIKQLKLSNNRQSFLWKEQKGLVFQKGELSKHKIVKELVAEIDAYSKKATEGLAVINKLEKEIVDLHKEISRIKAGN